MKKFKYIFLTLLTFLLTSCGKEVDINFESIDCKLDKDTYQINEDIVLSFDGELNNFERGDLIIEFFIYKLENEKREKIPPLNVLNSGNLVNESSYKNYFIAWIFKDSILETFNDEIVMNITESGNYQIIVSFEGHLYKYNKEQKPIEQKGLTMTKDFTIDFEVL